MTSIPTPGHFARTRASRAAADQMQQERLSRLAPGHNPREWENAAIGRARTPTYTVYSPDDTGHVEGGLTVAAAARELLTADGYEYVIVREDDGDGFRLLISMASRNSAGPRALNRSVFFSLAPDQAAAEAEIFAAVVAHDGRWHGLEAMTDDAYAAMIADTLADDVESVW